jgi:replicative DNA helicase
MEIEELLEGKKIPHSIDIEKTVLGTILLESFVLDKVSKDFSSNLFFNSKNKVISKVILELYKDSIGIDLLTVVQRLKQNEKLKDAGGVKYISSLTNGIASSAHIDYHLKILQEEALRRNIIKISNESIQKAFDPTHDIFDVFNQTQHNLDNSLKNVINYEIKTVGQIHSDVISQSIKILQSGEKSGVPTGLRMLDNVTNGWQNSDLIILAGRPGMGKTSAVVSMGIFPSVNLNKAIAIFSLEMSSEQLVSRMQAYYSSVNVSKIVKKQLTEDEIVQIERSTEKLKNAPIFIDDTPNISLLELKGKVRKLKKENNIELVIIDYLQLMKSGLKTQSREQEIAEISRGLKSLAKELNIPVIALSQLSRSVEIRGGDKKPMLSDLRESGAIEQDADMVLFCYRPEYYGIDFYEVGSDSFDANGLFMLIVAKHRNGELGEIPLRFISHQTKITNYDGDDKSSFQSIDLKALQFTQEMNQLKPNTSFEDNLFESPPF